MERIANVADVRDWRLCLGCGACAYICPQQKITLVDFSDEGIRPVIDEAECSSCATCLEVCPAYENDHTSINRQPNLVEEVKPFYGPVLEIWEGHAADHEIRFSGSSGGVITALALYCLEQECMHGVLHIAQDADHPLRNKTRLSRTRAELLTSTGSRYAPAATCDRLDLVEHADGACVVVGQPSEITALQKARRLRPELDRNTGLTISFFCAGSPSTHGTVQLLKSMGIDPAEVTSFRYRGNGWPGNFAVTVRGETAPTHFRTYQESWGLVEAYRPFSTHLCPDGTGEDADISCGDPWYREVREGEPGSSIVVARTERGVRILRGAIQAGYVALMPAEPWKLLKSQPNLIKKRGAVGGRIATLRALGLPAPKLGGFFLARNWLRLSLSEKLRSTVGTVRRVLTRGYYKRVRRTGVGNQVVTRHPNCSSLANGHASVRPADNPVSISGEVEQVRAMDLACNKQSDGVEK